MAGARESGAVRRVSLEALHGDHEFLSGLKKLPATRAFHNLRKRSKTSRNDRRSLSERLNQDDSKGLIANRRNDGRDGVAVVIGQVVWWDATQEPHVWHAGGLFPECGGVFAIPGDQEIRRRIPGKDRYDVLQPLDQFQADLLIAGDRKSTRLNSSHSQI